MLIKIGVYWMNRHVEMPYIIENRNVLNMAMMVGVFGTNSYVYIQYIMEICS